MLADIEAVFQWVGNIAVLGMLIPLAVFIALYKFGSPWRENELGIALMGQKIALLTMVVVAVAGNFLPEDWDFVRRTFRALLFVAVLFFLIIDVVNLRRYQTGSGRLFFHFLTLSEAEAKRRRRAQAKAKR